MDSTGRPFSIFLGALGVLVDTGSAKTFAPLDLQAEVVSLFYFLLQLAVALSFVAFFIFFGWFVMWRLFLGKYKVVRDLVAVFFPDYVAAMEKRFGAKKAN